MKILLPLLLLTSLQGLVKAQDSVSEYHSIYIEILSEFGATNIETGYFFDDIDEITFNYGENFYKIDLDRSDYRKTLIIYSYDYRDLISDEKYYSALKAVNAVNRDKKVVKLNVGQRNLSGLTNIYYNATMFISSPYDLKDLFEPYTSVVESSYRQFRREMFN